MIVKEGKRMKSEYVRKYQEMDRDCALLSRYQTQEGEERQGLLIPDDEGCPGFGGAGSN